MRKGGRVGHGFLLTSVRALMRSAREADVLVLPTPPLPVTKISLGREPGTSSAEDSREPGAEVVSVAADDVE